MEEKLERLWKAARNDEAFRKVESSYSKLEKMFEKTVAQLPSRQQDIMWGFVLKSTELDRYLLNLALDDKKVP